MTAACFVDLILIEYVNTAACPLSASERAVSREYLVSDISRADLEAPITRKLAALTLHRAMVRLTREHDDDWGIASGFKDIYDCRVCANAVAQVSVKGIMEPVSSTEFGMGGVLSDEEALKAVLRLFDTSLRV